MYQYMIWDKKETIYFYLQSVLRRQDIKNLKASKQKISTQHKKTPTKLTSISIGLWEAGFFLLCVDNPVSSGILSISIPFFPFLEKDKKRKTWTVKKVTQLKHTQDQEILQSRANWSTLPPSERKYFENVTAWYLDTRTVLVLFLTQCLCTFTKPISVTAL